MLSCNSLYVFYSKICGKLISFKRYQTQATRIIYSNVCVVVVVNVVAALFFLSFKQIFFAFSFVVVHITFRRGCMTAAAVILTFSQIKRFTGDMLS